MTGSKSGALKAAETNKRKFGEDFYSRIGRIGGKKGTTGGFAAFVECKRFDCNYNKIEPVHFVRECAGYRGGIKSRRKKEK